MTPNKGVASLQQQGQELSAQGRLSEASRLCRQALRSVECRERNSFAPASLLCDLAEIELDRQAFEPALKFALRAVLITRTSGARAAGTSRNDAVPLRIRALHLAGRIRTTLGDYARGEVHLKEALQLSIHEWGDTSEQAAIVGNDLAILYKYWGRFEDGLSLYQRVLRSMVAIHGKKSLAVSTVFHNIGGILHASKDFVAAEPPSRKAWAISRGLLGDNDPRTLIDAVAYAAVLDGLGRYHESEPIYRHALAIFRKAYGRTHYEVASTLHNLAAVLAARGRNRTAEKQYREALVIKSRLLGRSNPDTALTANNLGKLLLTMGRAKEAVGLLRPAVKVLKTQLRPDHPDLAIATRNLNAAMAATGRRNKPQTRSINNSST